MFSLTREGVSKGPLISAAHCLPRMRGLLTAPLKELRLALAKRHCGQFLRKSKAFASSLRTLVRLWHLHMYLVRSALG